MTLRGRIKIQMAAHGIDTGAELARRVGVHRQTVQKWLDGDVQNIELTYLFKLADVLKCSARWLALRDGAPQQPVTLTLERTKVVQLYDALKEHKLANAWVRSGEAMIEDTGVTSTAQPFKQRERVERH